MTMMMPRTVHINMAVPLLTLAGRADENNHDQGPEIGADENAEQQSGPEWRHVTARERSMNRCVAGVLIGLDVAELFA